MGDADARAIVAAAMSAWSSPLEQALFGTSEPAEIVRLVDGFCLHELGASVADMTFYRRGVGVVTGVILSDGTRVAVKFHRRDLVHDHLRDIRRVQSAVADAGLPAPRPLGSVVSVAGAVATAEELFDRGRVADAHDPLVRRHLVQGLTRFVEEATPLFDTLSLPSARPFDLPADRLWPTPHDLRFDFALAGGEWIDDIARSARTAMMDAVGRSVIGHTDWRVENLRFDDGIVAIFDWDSVAVCIEPALVGANAVGFTADWSDRTWDPYPSSDEMVAFIAEYEEARGTAFTLEERATAEAARVYGLAYNARCEHSDVTLRLAPNGPPDAGWRALLRQSASP